MIKTLQWIYKLGYNHAEGRISAQIQAKAAYHSQQARIQLLSKDQPDDREDWLRAAYPRLTPQQHETVAHELHELLDEINPPQTHKEKTS